MAWVKKAAGDLQSGNMMKEKAKTIPNKRMAGEMAAAIGDDQVKLQEHINKISKLAAEDEIDKVRFQAAVGEAHNFINTYHQNCLAVSRYAKK